MEAVGSFAVGVVQVAIWFAVLFGAAWIADKASKRRKGVGSFSDDERKRERRGWLVFLVAFAVLAAIFYKPYQVLGEYNCRNADDFEACMDGE